MSRRAALPVDIGDDEPVSLAEATSHGALSQLALRLKLERLAAAIPSRRITAADRGIPKWMLDLAIQTRRNAKVRGIAYALSDADLSYLARRCAGRCEMSGILFSSKRDGKGKRAPFRASLDRVDCGKGYEAGNVRVVCALANLAMNEWGEEPLRLFVRAMAEQIRR